MVHLQSGGKAPLAPASKSSSTFDKLAFNALALPYGEKTHECDFAKFNSRQGKLTSLLALPAPSQIAGVIMDRTQPELMDSSRYSGRRQLIPQLLSGSGVFGDEFRVRRRNPLSFSEESEENPERMNEGLNPYALQRNEYIERKKKLLGGSLGVDGYAKAEEEAAKLFKKPADGGAAYAKAYALWRNTPKKPQDTEAQEVSS